MITDVAGVRAGHWTDRVAETGCSVVLFPDGTVGSGEVRGGAPATRETDVLDPTRMVSRLDAVLLTGGSAFGLAAADGVMAWCEARGIGFPTKAGQVPIVVALGLYDLAVGDSKVRPGPAEGRVACESSSDGQIELGRVGAGTGATVAKWRGPAHRRPGGIVSATCRRGDLVVSALVAVNSFGEPGTDPAEVAAAGDTAGAFTAERGTNTTVAVLATNAALDKVGLPPRRPRCARRLRSCHRTGSHSCRW